MSEINLSMVSLPKQPQATADGVATPLPKEHLWLLLASLCLGFLFNLFFYGKTLGLSYPLYVIVVYTVIFWLLHRENKLHFTWDWLWALPIWALSFTYFFFTNQIFAILNFLLIPVLLVSHTLLLTSKNRYPWFKALFVLDILLALTLRPLLYCLKPFSLLNKIVKIREHSGKTRAVLQVLTGLLAAFLLFLIIVPLLASADDIFRHYISQLPNIFWGVSIGEITFRTFIVVMVACLSFSYLWSLFVAGTVCDCVVTGKEEGRSPAFLEPVAVTAFLVLVDLLYAFFIAIQFSYLFGSLQYGLPQDFTYAEYARKGFFELVAVTVINLAILLANLHFRKASGCRADRIIQILNAFLVIATVIMLLSAHFRMSLYEEAYGLTYLRVLTHAFMGYLLVLFAVNFIKIWVPKVCLLKAYLVISLLAYTLLNYLNIDNLIAENNIARYQKGNPVDILYLTTLSYEAVPQLVDFLQNTPERELAEKVEKGLAYKKNALERDTSWQSFNISRERAKKVFALP